MKKHLIKTQFTTKTRINKALDVLGKKAKSKKEGLALLEQLPYNTLKEVLNQ